MKNTFKLKIKEIQPSQLYLNKEKLQIISEMLRYSPKSQIDPIPIKKLLNRLVATDGHSRLFVAWQHGFTEIDAYWDIDEEDWEAYEICVNWCLKEEIEFIGDLQNRIIDNEDYSKLWIERCRKMHNNLKQRPQDY